MEISKEKQIEEMAWELCDIPRHPNIKSCEQCGNKHCHAMYYAERAYEAGYRKQSEGEWEKHLDEYDCEFAKCSHCGEEYYDASGEDTIDMFYNFCPNCGSKMKGGEVG